MSRANAPGSSVSSQPQKTQEPGQQEEIPARSKQFPAEVGVAVILLQPFVFSYITMFKKEIPQIWDIDPSLDQGASMRSRAEGYSD